MQRILLRSIIAGILSGITLYRCFVSIGSAPVERWDEQTNITVIESSLESLPILYLYDQPFFEKPPLWYLANIVTAKLIGVNPFSMRLVSALFGMGIIILSGYLAYTWWGVVAAYTTWITMLTTNHLFISNPARIFSTHTLRSADSDSMYIFFLVSAFALSVSFVKHATTRTALGTGAVSALAVLTKTPFGLVPLIGITLHTVLKKRKNMRYLGYSWGMLLLATIPWHLFMILRFGYSFVYSYGTYHIFMRTILPLEGHNNPIWYYLPIVSHPLLFPAFLLLPFTVGVAIGVNKLTSDVRLQMCLAMALACIIVPTLMQTKLAWYILPFYPFAALTIGAGMQHALHSKGYGRYIQSVFGIKPDIIHV